MSTSDGEAYASLDGLLTGAMGSWPGQQVDIMQNVKITEPHQLDEPTEHPSFLNERNQKEIGYA